MEFTTQLKKSEDIVNLYESLGWNNYLNVSQEELLLTMQNSFYVLYIYDHYKLIGTGRVISDGVINAYICGLGVDSNYRNKGIGTELMKKIIEYCQSFKLHVQLFCAQEKIPYYDKLGFETFAYGMKLKD